MSKKFRLDDFDKDGDTNVVTLSQNLIRTTEILKAEAEVRKIVKDLKSIKNVQWAVSLLAMFGLAFGVRIHEYCDRGYQPTQVQ
jgi:hypothetical protein